MRYLYRAVLIAFGLAGVWFSSGFVFQDERLHLIDVWGFLVYLVFSCELIWDGVFEKRAFITASRASGLAFIAIGALSATIGATAMMQSRPLDMTADMAVVMSFGASVLLIGRGTYLVRAFSGHRSLDNTVATRPAA